MKQQGVDILMTFKGLRDYFFCYKAITECKKGIFNQLITPNVIFAVGTHFDVR